MTIQDTVNQIKNLALDAAKFKEYSIKDVICFGYVPERNLWRLVHQFNGISMAVMESSVDEGERLLDEAFANVEAKGMRLLIIVGNKAMKY